MPFTIDEESLLIKGRRGDTASFTFNFDENISAYNVHFYVKKNINDTDAEAIINKTYNNPPTNSIVVNLSTQDTEKLTAQANSYSAYYWGLRIGNGINFAQTVIPQEFKTAPMMYIYPAIGGV